MMIPAKSIAILFVFPVALYLPDYSCTYISLTPTLCFKQFYKFSLLLKVAAGATEVAVFGSASETFSKKNINCSIDESMLKFEEVIHSAKERQIPVRGSVFCIFDGQNFIRALCHVYFYTLYTL